LIPDQGRRTTGSHEFVVAESEVVIQGKNTVALIFLFPSVLALIPK
jgi:hypothetical protein